MKFLLASLLLLASSTSAMAGTTTWDGKHDTSRIEVTVVYFVPADRPPLPDWRERVDYLCRRIELFHAREFQEQSVMKTLVHEQPLVSELDTAELRRGDGDAIFFRTLREADRRLAFAQQEQEAFPILLVLSEINWQPLDDFYRLKPQNGSLVFEGSRNGLAHVPGATSGGARATYLADRGVGWGLVSADGWRVPYRGSDCVVYHEGCGHTVGLPHPEPGNGSVMSLGQYQGWLSDSWLDRDQKSRMGWEPQEVEVDAETRLFSKFRAVPNPETPKPKQPVSLALTWPDNAKVESVRVRFQTAIDGPWIEVPQSFDVDAPAQAQLATFERETPVSYRVNAELDNGAQAELWGYFQVQTDPKQLVMPFTRSTDLIEAKPAVGELATLPQEQIDLLAITDPAKCWTAGEWSLMEGSLESPKGFGRRLELPYSPPEEYRLTLIVEPLDPPNGLIIGQRMGSSRFAALFNYTPEQVGLSAIEDIDGKNVGNETTFQGNVFQQNRLSEAIITVRKNQVTMSVDGNLIVNWKGKADRLSLSDYWSTPNSEALFLGAYDCRYRFHRISLEPLSGEGTIVERKAE